MPSKQRVNFAQGWAVYAIDDTGEQKQALFNSIGRSRRFLLNEGNAKNVTERLP